MMNDNAETHSKVSNGASFYNFSNAVKTLFFPVLFSIMIFSISGYQINKIVNVRYKLKHNMELLIEKDNLINNVYDSFGYGGFIHNFKNYVLRNDEKYLMKFKSNKEEILKLLSLYESKIESTSEVVHTQIIRDTINTYSSEILKVQSLHVQGYSIDKIDGIVKVKNEAYFNSFLWIRNNIESSRNETLNNIHKTFSQMIESFVLGLISSILFVFIISFISYKRLIDSREDARKNAKVKSIFLANMSHEIRTPLNGVLGMLQLLSETNLNKEQDEMLVTTKSCSESLLTIINDVLDTTNIESENFSLENANFNVNQCVNEAVYLSSKDAQNHNVNIEFESIVQKELWLEGDISRIRQILVNFILNAIKYSEKGEVFVTVDSRSISDEYTDLTLRVRDNGIGIHQSELDQLFKSFSQGDSSSTKKYSGVGLGLSLCNRLAILMNGSISVKSIKDEGSEFSFNVVLKNGISDSHNILNAKNTPHPFDKKFAETYSHKLLVVEDNIVNQKLMIIMLKKLGYSCDIAEDGQKALEALEKNRDYTLVLMDIQMPVMDGIEATRKIIDIYGKNRPHVVAVTANVFTEDREKCFDCGMEDFIPKPIKKEELMRVLSRFSVASIKEVS